MEKLSNWNAKRSGATMTVEGLDEAGTPQRVTGVDSIEFDSTVDTPRALATSADGRVTELVCS